MAYFVLIKKLLTHADTYFLLQLEPTLVSDTHSYLVRTIRVLAMKISDHFTVGKTFLCHLKPSFLLLVQTLITVCKKSDIKGDLLYNKNNF